MFSKLALLFACFALTNAALIPTGYKFGYDIQGPDDGNSREESRDENGNVRGFYTIKGADGLNRRVTYYTDENGFHANIESNEPGVMAKSSANAQFNGAELPKNVPETTTEALNEPGLVPSGYNFGYSIDGPDSQSRQESSEGGRVTGHYMLRDADGRQRRVSYTADEQGFHASIDTNEEGTANLASANADIKSPFAAPKSVEPLPVPKVELPQAPTEQKTLIRHEAEPIRQTPTVYEAPRRQDSYTSSSHSTVNFQKTIEHAPVQQKPTFELKSNGDSTVASWEKTIEHRVPAKKVE